MAPLKKIENLRVSHIIVVNGPDGDDVIYDREKGIDKRASSKNPRFLEVRHIARKIHELES